VLFSLPTDPQDTAVARRRIGLCLGANGDFIADGMRRKVEEWASVLLGAGGGSGQVTSGTGPQHCGR